MGYEIPDSAVIPRKKWECRLLPLIGICFCTILSVLLVMAICDRRMFDRVINGPLSELEINLKQNIRQSMELRWETFRIKYNKEYNDEINELTAKLQFFENQIFVDKHNLRYAKNEVTYQVGVNKFSDVKPEHFVKIYNGYRKNFQIQNRKYFFSRKMKSELPKTVDWRRKGAVTNVKDQGQCGSCWAFSTTGALEGRQFINNKRNLTSLSEQNLIDCATGDNNAGCKGGDPDDAFWYIYRNGGIDTEEEYPYTAKQGTCKYRVDNLNITVNGYSDIESGNEGQLQEAVATIGPISVAIDASHQSFQSYKQGVYNDNQCSSLLLDHAVLVVGYGTDPVGGAYWLVKNSWGKDWGDEGYIKIARDQSNMCGIASVASYPTV